MPQAKVADLMQAFGQHVLQEAAHELGTGKPRLPPSVRGAMLVAEADSIRVQAHDPVVGDGGAEHVTGEIAQHRLRALTPGRAVDDLWLPPDSLGQGQSGAMLGQRGTELPRTSLAKAAYGTRKP